MRFVVHTGPGQVELNYLWLPTWIGMNKLIKEEMEAALAEKVEGRPLTEETLDEVHAEVVDWLSKRFGSMPGLFDYLDAIKHVR